MAGKPLRVLGVDTSLRSTGAGVVEARGTSLQAVRFSTIKNPSDRLHSECVAHIYAEIQALISAEQPDEVAVEGIFHCRNARTAVVLGEARGAVLAACAAANLPVYEYPPRRVKQAIVGTGSAHKDQVARMVMSMLGISQRPKSDESDALAIAICHIHSRTGHPSLAPGRI